jgi:hypothetical protein
MALQGEFVRLYCVFEHDGQLYDPAAQPRVMIVDNNWHQESSSSSTASSASSLSETEMSTSSGGSSFSSSESSGPVFGPFFAQKESTGVWFVDWLVPASLSPGNYYDVWTFRWDGSGDVQRLVFEINVKQATAFINWTSPSIAQKIGDTGVSMMMELANSFIFEAQHIWNHWEQGFLKDDPNTLYFAYPNWNQDPRPLLRKNSRLVANGWQANMMGVVRLETTPDPEDQFFVQYQFRYFSDEELLSFLNEGLYMMNAIPPASAYYSSLGDAPFNWRAGIVLYAAIQALRRLVFGLNFGERAIIFGETWDNHVQASIDNFKALYTDYMTLWMEISKNIKKILPGISQFVTPEYTLPGGRSRWFRYLYKS